MNGKWIVLVIMLLLVGIASAATVTTTVYLSADTGDKWVAQGANSNWTTMRNAAGDTTGDGASTQTNQGTMSTSTSQLYDIMWRLSYSFNTSSLPDDSTITAVTFGIYPISKVADLDPDWTLGVTGASPATNGTWVAGDYDSFGNTEYITRIAYASIPSNTSYLNMSFNAAGIENVSKTSWTNLMLRTLDDLENSNSSLTWSSVKADRIRVFDYTEVSGKQPFLEITYEADTTPPASITSLSGSNTVCQDINWTFTKPTDVNYNGLMVYKDGTFFHNLTSTTTHDLWTGLVGGTSYTFSSKTFDTSNNVNETWVNSTVSATSCLVANFTSNVTTGSSPLIVQFTDTTPSNLYTYSEQFDNAAWTKTRTSITANAAVSPAGTTTADKLVEDASETASHHIDQVATLTANNTPFEASVYLKAEERDIAQISIGDSNFNVAYVTKVFLTNGTTLQTDNPPGVQAFSSNSTSIGSGWYRYIFRGTIANYSTARMAIYIRNASGSYIYTGDGSSGLYIWGAQLDQIPTLPATANLLHNTEKLDEPILYDVYHANITANAVTAPDGTLTADKLVENTFIAEGFGSDDHYFNPSIWYLQNLTDNTNYTFSLYVKSAERTHIIMGARGRDSSWTGGSVFNLSSGGYTGSESPSTTSAGDGWWRCKIKVNTKSGGDQFLPYVMLSLPNNSGQYTGDGISGVYVWGTQLETGDTMSAYSRVIDTDPRGYSNTTDTVINPTIARSWYFWGNETASSTSQNPLQTFTTGTYNIRLNASNTYGFDWENKTGYITVTDVTTPVVAFTCTKNFIRIPNTITCTDTSTNTPTSWSWNMGDGSAVITTQNVTYQYLKRGSWGITLNATNAGGSNTTPTATNVRVMGYENYW